MAWQEKRPKNADANIKNLGDRWEVRIKLLLPNRQIFERQKWATSRTEARKVRDSLYVAYNSLALDILTEVEETERPPERLQLTLRELAEKCRDEWWPAKGRSAEVADQYFQKMRDYCVPVLGEDRLIERIAADDWDRILIHLLGVFSDRAKPLSESTIRKVKAVLSSALTCAVSHHYLASNPIKGLPFNPHPIAEADRLGASLDEVETEDAPAKRMLNDAEALQILAKSKNRLIYPMIVLQLAFGLRIAEALAVKWSDFDETTGELKVRFQVKRRKNPRWTSESSGPRSILQRLAYLKSKAGKRNIYRFDDAAELLATLPRRSENAVVCPNEWGGLMEPRNAQRMFHQVLEAAELPGERPTTHSLRSWRISYWANELALPPSQLQRLAGHTRIETTLRYYVRSDNDSLKRWLDGRGPVSSVLAPHAPLAPAQGGTDQPLQSESGHSR